MNEYEIILFEDFHYILLENGELIFCTFNDDPEYIQYKIANSNYMIYNNVDDFIEDYPSLQESLLDLLPPQYLI